MNQVLNRILDQLSDVRSSADRQLLDRFLAARDEGAFAELVRRYGPVVWGACRRQLAHHQDAEDAFQATFLVLLRRAARLPDGTQLGPWLYQVAVMTARNVIRGNCRRAAVTGPMEYEIAAPDPGPSAERPDLDAALLSLPERDRLPVVLCHLQGLTRREAAERLGCPEGTLSARLNRALRHLRTRLGPRTLAALAGGAVAAPTGLLAGAVRSATIYSTSTAAGVSPVVVGLTDGVLRMLLMKKVTTAALMAVFVLGVGALVLGMSGGSPGVARDAEPVPVGASAPPAPAEEPDALKRLEKRLADLEKQKELLDTTLKDLKTEKQKLNDARREKEAVAELGRDIAVVVGNAGQSPPYTVREVVNGRITEVSCSDLDILTTYLARVFNDPKGPKKLRISALEEYPADLLRSVFAACASAGYTKAAFGHRVRGVIVTYIDVKKVIVENKRPIEAPPKPGEIDLTKYAEPRKP